MTEDEIFAALDATWPAAETSEQSGWTLRNGAGGGKRVSAASQLTTSANVAFAADVMRSYGQTPLFQVRGNEPDLDQALDDAGYRIVDPVSIYAAPVQTLTDGKSEQSRIYRCQFPVAVMEELWAEGGIDACRLAVMDRAKGPKSWLMTRLGDHPAGAAFVSAPGVIAMVHAIEVATTQRRKGAARALISGAATFAAEAGAAHLALAVTKANVGANLLYQSLGMTVAAEYHYRTL